MPLQVPCSVLMDDLDLALCTDEPGAARAHGGFLRAYLSVREAVHRLLKELGGTTLLVTGHSLGGALAVLAACDFGAQFRGNLKCITFGSPRVGNSEVRTRTPKLQRGVCGETQ